MASYYYICGCLMCFCQYSCIQMALVDWFIIHVTIVTSSEPSDAYMWQLIAMVDDQSIEVGDVVSQLGFLASNGPLTSYENLRVAHAPGMPGTLSPSPRVSDPHMNHGMCVTHEPWCMPGSLTSGFQWSQWRGKRFRHSWGMRKPQC